MSLPSLQKYHKAPYPAIDPKRPELSQAGKTVLITGGNTGIGFAIARAFTAASAKRVILTGRRPDVVRDSAAQLAREAEQLGSPTVADGRVCDVSSLEASGKLWADLQAEGIVVDVLVLNAAAMGAQKSILENGRDGVWQDFLVNVRTPLDFAERLYKQPGQGTRQKFIVNVSTIASYMWTTMGGDRPTYGLTKLSGNAVVQQIARDVKPEVMQIVSFHPGGILSESARKHIPEQVINSMVWDDENLPGRLAVFLASPEAEFLHGRFIWSNWDVEELKTGVVGEQIKKEPHFLKAGIEGLSESMLPPKF
ncbi:NAD(P)-binding protein [Sodiomyces alkalinus F11]|uniref:NAD(P)-binding protein n=1 Tax=Sodiomyces alkalinus (strain CBS 110278 / VKM F-3762 / F11) TaxID=1314773 RepID=A0A3N2PTH4_SODAK|nr:NAD(P)-binding protein [Sodiomyces alkalinus F11]ROT37791.1 NAD(P)-binding protein [Sodiomyces alkalinus F11]